MRLEVVSAKAASDLASIAVVLAAAMAAVLVTAPGLMLVTGLTKL